MVLLERRRPGLEEFGEGLPERLKEARRKANLTQAELAYELGVSARAIETWEQGFHVPNMLTARDALRRFFARVEALPAPVKRKWSKHNDECRLCHRDDRDHKRGGVCVECYRELSEATIVAKAEETPPLPLEERACKNGHRGEMRKQGTKTRCLACVREYRKAKKARE